MAESKLYKKEPVKKLEITTTASKRESINSKAPDKQLLQRVVVGSDVRH